MQSPDDVLSFWFDEHGQEDWFGGKPEFDAALAARFAPTHAAVAAGEAYLWRKSIEGRLAEIIVLDQFSRQLYRGSPKAFVQDGMALVLAQEAIATGLDQNLPVFRRMFLFMPFVHSESLVMQAQSIRLFQSFGEEGWLKYAHGHLETIQKFGRFPARNKALDRESTPDELAYIAESAARSS